MRAPKRARAILNVKGLGNGTFIVNFSTEVSGERIPVMYYHPYPAKVDMQQPRDLLVEFWEQLDRVIDEVKRTPSDAVKTEATTLAWTIAKIMSPFYDDATAVLRESQKRWEARQAGAEHESPGLAESIWDPNTRFDGTAFSNENLERVRRGQKVKVAPRPTGNKVPENIAAQVKDAIEKNMFTVAQIANTYAMTEQEVKEQLGLA